MKLLPLVLCLIPAVLHAQSTVRHAADGTVILENEHLRRVVGVERDVSTTSIVNKLDQQSLAPASARAFVIHLADGSAVSSADCAIVNVVPEQTQDHASLSIELTCEGPAMDVTILYTLNADEPFTRKRLKIRSRQDLRIASIDLESLSLAEAYQPYTISRITARGAADWRPGLGQPLYTKRTGTYWGVEFPAAQNTVRDGRLRCSYRVGKDLATGESYQTYAAVAGVADTPDEVQAAFFDYIDRTRVRPLRLQTQYNTWFDHGSGVRASSFGSSVVRIHDELHTQRGVPPLRAYVIDDGWQDTGKDWSKRVWQVNAKFDPKFADSTKSVSDADSSLGLWLSPGCLFGGQRAIPSLKNAGLRSLDPWMSMADPGYMELLEARMVELTQQGVTYFKLDGVFGHLNTRNFEVPGFKGSEAELNDPKYDDQKVQYLSDGSERLIKVFAAMHAANPDVYIVISNGAWLSPWWLQHIDAVWMINAGDAAGGSSRTDELVYRDGVYHDLAVAEQTQFPLHSIFNHEPKKTSSRETKDTFRRYLYMSLSRGTGFVELYIKPSALKPYDWDVLAEGLHWVHTVFPTFKRARMHGGDPQERQVYGYTGWSSQQGYLSIHNPAATEQAYRVTLNRDLGLPLSAKGRKFHLSSPIDGSLSGLPQQAEFGDTLTVNLKPREIRIINLDVQPRDWQTLRELQTRSTDDYVPPKPLPIEGHAILGVWKYGPHQREFKTDGTCTLTSGTTVQWTKPFIVTSAREAIVEGRYRHLIQPDGSLRIESRYTAHKQP